MLSHGCFVSSTTLLQVVHSKLILSLSMSSNCVCGIQVQSDDFLTEKCTLHNRSQLPKKSCLRTLHPILEESGLLRVAGRVHNSHFSFSQRHPVFLDGKHPLTKLIIRAEHIRLLHTGPTLVSSSFGRSLHIIRQCKRCLHNYTCLYYLLAYDC